MCIVISQLDYSNEIIIGLPKHEISRLQRALVLVARAVLEREAREDSTISPNQLHWLRMYLRIQHKILSLVFKALKGTAPQYLKNMLKLSKNEKLFKIKQYVHETGYFQSKRTRFSQKTKEGIICKHNSERNGTSTME